MFSPCPRNNMLHPLFNLPTQCRPSCFHSLSRTNYFRTAVDRTGKSSWKIKKNGAILCDVHTSISSSSIPFMQGSLHGCSNLVSHTQQNAKIRFQLLRVLTVKQKAVHWHLVLDVHTFARDISVLYLSGTSIFHYMHIWTSTASRTVNKEWTQCGKYGFHLIQCRSNECPGTFMSH